MRQTVFRGSILCLLLAICPNKLAGYASEVDLAQVSRRVEDHIRQTRKEWKHELVPPLTPPGYPLSDTVVIHKWTSERCGTVALRLDGKSYGEQPVPCVLSLIIDQSSSATVAIDRLSRFVNKRGRVTDLGRATPIPIGDKGYVQDGQIVFVKGRFMFYVRASADLRVGEFSISRDFEEKMAKEIAEVVRDI